MTLTGWLVLLLCSLTIGYLAQVTGLCLVRGVLDWMRGRRIRLLAILVSGFWLYLFLPLIPLFNLDVHLSIYEVGWTFFVGGLAFGLGAGVNGACAISTATRFASGDVNMLSTMMGWLAGWLLLEYAGVDMHYQQVPVEQGIYSWVAITVLLCLTVYVCFRYPQMRRLWLGITLVGMLAGVVFLLQPLWSPSDFIRDLGLAIVHKSPKGLPSLDRVMILAGMMLGMMMGAWRHGRFHLSTPNRIALLKHFPAGALMGVGTALALGGNDFQLMLGLPGFSPAALAAIAGMLLGITMVIQLKKHPPKWHGLSATSNDR